MQRLEKLLFYLFLFLIPFQIRTILYWGWNEWNSVFLYLGDILLILIFLLAAFRKRFSVNWRIQKQDFLLILFLLITTVSLLISINQETSIYRLIKLLEFVLLFIYIKSNLKFLKFKNIFSVLIISGVLQSILAIAQFLNQKSLELKFIEAGIFNPNMPGVANFIYDGERIMRSYASFPHPNVLAGFLLLCIFAFYALWLNREKISWLLIIGYGLLIFSLFLTFSRAALVVFIFITLVFFLVKFFQLRPLSYNKERILASKKVLTLSILFIAFCLLSTALLFPYLKARFFTISFEEQAIDLRFFYNKMSFAMIKEKPFLGVGIGNFVFHSQNHQAFLRAAKKIFSLSEYQDKGIPEWLFQPVHNIYLLIAVEAGIIGLLLFLLFVSKILLKRIRIEFKKISSRNLSFLFLIFSFLFLGLLDHYFWTLHQGGIIFWTALALLDS